MSNTKGDHVPVKQSDDDIPVAAVVPDGLTMDVIKGEIQEPAYRDWQFSVLFFVQLAAISITAVVLGPAWIASLSNDDDDEDNGADRLLEDNGSASNSKWTSFDSIFFFVGSLLGASVVIMSVFRMMIHKPLLVIKISFFVAPVTFGFVALVILIASSTSSDGSKEGDVHDQIVGFFWAVAAVFSLFSVCFYYCYKRFMPFAAVNLKAALTAVRSNTGLFFLSVASIFATYGWMILWSIALASIVYHDQQKDQVPCSEQYDYDGSDHSGMCDQQPNAVAITMLVLCFYWTQQVIQNTVHTTTAGTVASWWNEPSQEYHQQVGGGCLGQVVSDAAYRACTYSFGSICLGSLLVAIMQTLENMARNNRNRRDVLSIVIQCLIICLRSWLEYFNSWAFCYVGIYGYNYVTAGKKVIELFKARGWTTLITDRLVFRVLLMANLGTAALTGAFCVLLMLFMGSTKVGNSDWPVALGAAFWIGFVIGLIISSTVLFVVESAVRTVMVCFAEQPTMDVDAPVHAELKETYAATYPNLFQATPQQSELETRNVV